MGRVDLRVALLALLVGVGWLVRKALIQMSRFRLSGTFMAAVFRRNGRWFRSHGIFLLSFVNEAGGLLFRQRGIFRREANLSEWCAFSF
jgi:hypothetical protein